MPHNVVLDPQPHLCTKLVAIIHAVSIAADIYAVLLALEYSQVPITDTGGLGGGLLGIATWRQTF